MSDTVIVTAVLVRHLRSGLRTPFGFAAQRIATLMLDFEDEPPADEYERAEKDFDAARGLLSDIPPTGDQPPAEIELDLSSNALLVLKALEGQHNAETDRLEEASFYGPNRDAACEEVQALGDLVREVKMHVLQTAGHPAAHFPEESHSGIGKHVQRRRSVRTRQNSRPRR